MHEIMLYDQIVPNMFAELGLGVSAKQFNTALNATNGEETVVRVSSPGGSVWEALAMESAIHQHGNVTYQVDGVAFSAASWIGMRAKNRTASKYSSWMIHAPYVMMEDIVTGNADELRDIATALAKTADRLEKDGEAIAMIYADNTSMSMDESIAAMNAETWYSATEAMDAGLFDSLTESEGEADGPKNVRRTSYVEQLMARAPQFISNRVRIVDEMPRRPAIVRDVVDRFLKIRLDEMKRAV